MTPAKRELEALKDPIVRGGFVSSEANIRSNADRLQKAVDAKDASPESIAKALNTPSSNLDYAKTYLKNPGLAAGDYGRALGRGNVPAWIGTGAASALAGILLYRLMKRKKGAV